MNREYVDEREGGYYISGARMSLDSIVYAFRGGESPESIQQNFPSLTLEQVYGAIAFYLGHKAEVDANIRRGEDEVYRLLPPLSQRRPEAYERLQSSRTRRRPFVSIRYQADSDLNRLIVVATFRRQPGIDFQTAQTAQLDRLDDKTVLRRAASEGRILITHDIRTMPRHFASFLEEGNTSPGVFLVIPQNAQLGLVVDTLILIWADNRPEDWENAITIVPF